MALRAPISQVGGWSMAYFKWLEEWRIAFFPVSELSGVGDWGEDT